MAAGLKGFRWVLQQCFSSLLERWAQDPIVGTPDHVEGLGGNGAHTRQNHRCGQKRPGPRPNPGIADAAMQSAPPVAPPVRPDPRTPDGKGRDAPRAARETKHQADPAGAARAWDGPSAGRRQQQQRTNGVRLTSGQLHRPHPMGSDHTDRRSHSDAPAERRGAAARPRAVVRLGGTRRKAKPKRSGMNN